MLRDFASNFISSRRRGVKDPGCVYAFCKRAAEIMSGRAGVVSVQRLTKSTLEGKILRA